jgi:hypothetical protein
VRVERSVAVVACGESEALRLSPGSESEEIETLYDALR